VKNTDIAPRSAVQKILVDVKSKPLLLCYVTTCFVWLNLLIQGPGVFGAVTVAGIALPSWTLPALFCAASYLMLGVYRKPFAALAGPRRHPAFLAATMLAGLALYLPAVTLYNLPHAVQLLMYAAGSAFAGFATAFVLSELARVFGNHAPRNVLSFTVVAVLASGALALPVLLAPAFVRATFLLILAVAISTLDWFMVREYPPHPSNKTSAKEDEASQSTPVRFMSMALPLGFANGVLAPGFMQIDPAGAAFANVAALFIAAGAMLLLAVKLELDFNQLIYQAGLPLTAMGALVLAIAPQSAGTGVEVLQFSGFLFTYYTVWGLCAMLIRYLQQSAIWTVSYSTACLMFGQFLGGVVGCVSAQVWGGRAFGVISFALIAALFMVAVLNAGHKSFHTGWGTAKPAHAVVEITHDRQETVERMAVIAGLTARERDVFAILAQGRGRQFVQKELVISDNTAKVHIHNVYNKLGVHSMQELVEAVERNSEHSLREPH